MIEKLLRELDFNEKEIAVYLTVLQQGSISPNEVAQVTGINRTTVYSVAKELIRRRVISEDLGTAARKLVAKPPTELRQLIIKQQERIEKQKSVAEQAIVEMQKIAKRTAFTIPKIVYIPEEDLESYLYRRAAVWSESIMQGDGIWWGFQDHTFVEHYQGWVDWYWKKGAPPKLQLQLLSNQSNIEEKMQEKPYARRKIKFWKKTVEFTGSTWVNGDYLVMIITNQHPHYLIEIHDMTLARNVREICKGIWKDVQ